MSSHPSLFVYTYPLFLSLNTWSLYVSLCPGTHFVDLTKVFRAGLPPPSECWDQRYPVPTPGNSVKGRMASTYTQLCGEATDKYLAFRRPKPLSLHPGEHYWETPVLSCLGCTGCLAQIPGIVYFAALGISSEVQWAE